MSGLPSWMTWPFTDVFKPPKTPDITPPPSPVVSPAPPTSEKDVEALKEEEKKKLKKGRERRGTILTGPRGILTPAMTERKTLLGE